MDGWPRIPNQHGTSSPTRTGGSLPAPGSVVMASVEEDLGEGMYALRWSGQRIAVSSRAALRPGQSLILKSELSPEGKPTLVVQGPALPDPGKIVGRVVYGPGHHGGKAQQMGARQSVDAQGGGQAGNAAEAQRGDGHAVGGQVAAGVARANAFTSAQPVQSLIGLVLEPLPEFDASVKILMKTVREEKERLEGKTGEKTSVEGEDGADDGETGQKTDAPSRDKSARPVLIRPENAPPPSQQAVRTEAVKQGGDRVAEAARPVQDSPPPAVDRASPSQSAPPETGKASESGGGESARTRAANTVEQPSPQSRPAPAPEGHSSATSTANAPAAPDATGVSGNRPSPEPQPAVPPEADVPRQPDQGGASSQSAAPAGQPPPAQAGTQTAGPVIPEVLVPGGTQFIPGSPPRSGTEIPTGGQQQSTPSGAIPSTAWIDGPDVPDVAPPTSAGPLPAAPEASRPQTPPAAGQQPQPATPGTAGPEIPPSLSTPTPAPAPEASGSQGASVPVPPPATPGGAVAPAIAETLTAGIIAGVETGASPAAGVPLRENTGEAQRVQAEQPATRETPPEATAAASPDQPEKTAQPRPPVNPEVFLKEALTQMVKAAELPLGSASAGDQSLGVGGRMPEAIVDKAAGILLRAAGLTPEGAALDAARALVNNNVQVDRETVQALITMAAGVEEVDRDAVLKAAARLSAKDVPLSDPLVAGLADVMTRKAGAHELMTRAVEALAVDPEVPEARPLLEGARELMDLLHVDLDRADAALALERYVSTFGREALGKALALVEQSAQAVLESNPQLQKIDQALTAILTQLQDAMAQYQNAVEPVPLPGQGAGIPGMAAPPLDAEPAPPAVPGGIVPGQTLPQIPSAATPETEDAASALPAPAPQPESAPVETPPAAPVPARPAPAAMSPINAYLKAPRAVPVEELLSKLPPMPKLVRLDQPVPQAPVTLAASRSEATSQDISLPPGGQPASPPLPGKPAETVVPLPAQAETEAAAGPNAPPAVLRGESTVLNKLDALFQIPGLNRPELELLKPSGFLERFLNSGADGADAARVKGEASTLLRQLTSENPEHVQRALQEIPRKDPAVLRETAARLTRMEAETMRAEPVLNRLSDAATSLRDLGRQLIAVKAENLAGQDRNPGVMLAEVPFKLNDDAGDGRMQMFYRRGKKKGDGWTSRVILDLNTTRMGPVLGDMRFFGQDMIVNMFVETPDTAAYLEKSVEDLIDGLWAKGFRVKTRFMVMPPPPAPVEIRAERPQITGEDAMIEKTDGTTEKTSSGGTSVRGRLDVKG